MPTQCETVVMLAAVLGGGAEGQAENDAYNVSCGGDCDCDVALY